MTATLHVLVLADSDQEGSIPGPPKAARGGNAKCGVKAGARYQGVGNAECRCEVLMRIAKRSAKLARPTERLGSRRICACMRRGAPDNAATRRRALRETCLAKNLIFSKKQNKLFRISYLASKSAQKRPVLRWQSPKQTQRPVPPGTARPVTKAMLLRHRPRLAGPVAPYPDTMEPGAGKVPPCTSAVTPGSRNSKSHSFST